MSKKIGSFLLGALWMCLPLLLWAQLPTVSLVLSKRKVMKELPLTVQWVLSADREADATPQWDLSREGIEVSFQGMTPNFSRSVTIINGKRTEIKTHRYTYTYTLIFHTEGIREVPGPLFSVDGISVPSGSFRIEVTDFQSNPYYSLSFSSLPKQLYVGERLSCSLRFYFLQPIQQVSVKIDEAEKDRFQLQGGNSLSNPVQFYLNDQIFEGEVISEGGGKCLRIPLSLVPTQPGSLHLSQSEVLFQGVGAGSQRDFWGDFTLETLRIRSDSPTEPIEVLPLPKKGQPADFNGLVGKISIRVKADPTQVRVGDPITLTLTLSDINDSRYEIPPFASFPALTALFSVPDTQAPGRTESGQKVWTQTIRPLKEGTYSIPPLSVNYFDTQSGRYRSVSSEPIPLSVAKANPLRADQLIFNASIPKELADAYSGNRQFHNVSLNSLTPGRFRRPVRSFSPLSLVCIVVLLLFLTAELIFIFIFKSRLIQRLAAQRNRSFLHILQTTPLQPQTLFDDLSRCRQRVLALSDETHSDFLSALDRTLFHAPLTLESAQSLLSLFIQREKECRSARADSGKPSPGSRKTRFRRLRSLFLGSAVFLLSLLSASCPETPSAAPAASADTLPPLTDERLATALSEAADAFNEGLRLLASGEGSPLTSFQTAYDKGIFLEAHGIVDDRLEFNLGNCKRFLNDDAMALVHYKKALLVRDKALYRDAVQAVMQKNGFSAQYRPAELFFSEFAHRMNGGPASVKVIVLLILLILWIGTLALSHFYRLQRGHRRWFFPFTETLLVVAMCVTLLALSFQASLPDPGEEGVVLSETALRYGDSDAYDAALETPLQRGQCCRCLTLRNGWVQVELPSGIRGWIPEKSLKLIQ